MSRRFTPHAQQTLIDIMTARRDVRGNLFLSDPISDQDLNCILNAVNVAPSVGLSQPWKLVVVQNEATKRKVYDSCRQENARAAATFAPEQRKHYNTLKLDGILEAPINIAVYYTPPKHTIIGNNTMPEMGEYSVVCAIQNMWLMARALNIGMGWVSILSPRSVNLAVGAPEDAKLIAYLCLGHVSQFLDKPELELQEWATRAPLETFIAFETF